MEIRTFQIPDADSEQAQAELSAFLRRVDVQRIDTAYVADGWRVLVLYKDMKRREESRQIEAAIAGALNAWRERAALCEGIPPQAVLADELLPEIARFAPTTEHELSIISGARGAEAPLRGGEIVQVVRSTLDELID
jgi:ribonuclease D